MQKARRHRIALLRPLVSVWFQGLFTPLFGVLFTFPSQYLFTIGLLPVFSLTGWCRLIQREFHQLPPTQEFLTSTAFTFTGLSPSVAYFPKYFKFVGFLIESPTTPILP